MGSVSNFISFLQTQQLAGTPQPPPVAPAVDPSRAVLSATGSAGLLPLADVVSATGLSAKAALDWVERLRARQQLEVVKDAQDQRFLRLTPLGYAALKGG